MLPFLPRVFTIDFSINDLRAENWQGYYSDGFEVPTVEDRILGRVTQEEGKLAEIYKDFLYKTEDIPKKLYLRELCYFKKLIACQKDSYRLKQLLAFNDSKSNIIKVITILITTINREICESYEEAFELLTNKNLHTKQLEQSIQKAMFLCELQGRSDGWRCRCRVRALSDSYVKKHNLTIDSSNNRLSEEERLVSKKSGEYKPVTVYTDPLTGKKIAPDVGWSYNPAANF